MPPSHVLHRLQRASARSIAVDPFSAPSTSPSTLVDPPRRRVCVRRWTSLAAFLAHALASIQGIGRASAMRA
jgi:hypothetical protein